MIRNAALTFALAAGVSQATVSTVGGNVQVVNLLNSAAQAGLDLTSTGSNVEIASFTVSNNTTSWTLAFAFLNRGVFVNSNNAGQTVPLTQITIQGNGGTLGTGPIAPDITVPAATPSFILAGDITAMVNANLSNVPVIWTPANQTTPTIGYIISMRGDWTAATTVLAGLYTETITATLTATL
jgi:hypothetical protein